MREGDEDTKEKQQRKHEEETPTQEKHSLPSLAMVWGHLMFPLEATGSAFLLV